jgi:hypothetical protein
MMLATYCFLLPVSFCRFFLSPSLSNCNGTDSELLSDITAVGVSLTLSYAAVSLRSEDGTFEDVGSIDGDKEYKEMMRRLSEVEARRSR